MILPTNVFRLLALVGIVTSGLVRGQASEVSPEPRPEFCVVTYNILEGFTNSKSERFPAGSERQAQVRQWLADQAPAIVALQELNGYSEERLTKEALAWGHAYAATVKESGYIVGLTSREPIEVIERHLEGMHHGVLHARTLGIECFVVHLSPFRFKHRQQETAMILQRVKKATDAGHPVLVMGDFNALSPQDRAALENDLESLERMRANDLKHDHIENLNQGKIDYTVMQMFLDAGLVDLYAQHRGSDELAESRRIDFILATPDLSKYLRNAGMFTDEAFRGMSDHPPVSARFAFPSDRAPHLSQGKRLVPAAGQ